MSALATASVTIASPIGRLTLTERDGALIRLTWSEGSSSDWSGLLRRASQYIGAYFAGDLKIFDLPLAT